MEEFEQAPGLTKELLARQRQVLRKKERAGTGDLEPLSEVASEGNPCLGLEAIAAGKVGCLLVAGGQGTRLGFKGPKGLFPIEPTTGKTLFQLFADKVRAMGTRVGRDLPFAIMTSPQNHEETVAYFRHHQFFGLYIDFFTQGTLPLLNEEGNWFFTDPGVVAEGPCGNGGAFSAFYEAGLWKSWRDRGVEVVNWVLVDNPLADPFDSAFIGYHLAENREVSLKVVPRRDAEEKVGVVVREGSRLKVLEYSELPDDVRGDCQRYPWANISLFCFSMAFLKKMASQELPWHVAHKTYPFLDREGRRVEPETPNAWKFETFVFDALPLAEQVGVMAYPRSATFAPLKNAEGADSPETVRKALYGESNR